MPPEIKYLVTCSGGACSWAAARRIVDRHGPEGVVGLFADTRMEDPDLYRFLDDAEADLGFPIVRIADGRDVWQVFIDEKFMGNTRVGICSRILKRDLMDRWIADHCRPGFTTIVFGLDWSERGRIEGKGGKGGVRRRLADAGWNSAFPMDEKPYLIKDEVFDWMASRGLRRSRMYDLGFPHDNCGGLCVKGGHKQLRHLLRTLPERFAYHERRQAEAMAAIGPSARPFLRDRTGGKTRGITLREFREQAEAFPLLGEDDGWGCGGGCAVDDDLPPEEPTDAA